MACLLPHLKDAQQAYAEHVSRDPDAVFRSMGIQPAPPPIHKRMQEIYHWFMYKAVSAEFAPIQRIQSPIYQKALKTSRAVANDVDKYLKKVRTAGHSLWHIPTEIVRAVYGGGKTQQGVRIKIDPAIFENLPEEALQLFRDAGVRLPQKNAKDGDNFFLTDYTFGDVVKSVGKKKWQQFEVYVWEKAALDRWQKKQLDYPGRTAEHPPERLKELIAKRERENPTWTNEFNRLNNFMDRLLLLNVMTGEIDAAQYRRITEAYDYYVPLPRIVERGAQGMGNSAGKLWSGLMRARGSVEFFKPLSESIEQRVRLAITSYYQNYLRNKTIEMGEKIAQMKNVPDDAKRAAARVMTPLNLDIKKVATLQPDEMQKVIADYLNQQAAEEFGVEVDELTADQTFRPSDVNVSFPGRPIFRATDPRAVNVVMVWQPNKGKQFYQVEDPITYDFMTRSESPQKAIGYIARMASEAVQPWKKSITHSPVFALWNLFARDWVTAMMFSKGWGRFVPGSAAAVGLVNRIMGKKGIPEARTETEILARSLEHTVTEQHRMTSNSFMDVLKEGIWLSGWKNMSAGEIIQHLPGQFSSAIAKPFELVNWATFSRWFSQTTETLTREGAYVLAKKRGMSDAEAQEFFDTISGNFIAKPGSATLAAIYKAGGFFNPAVQVIGQHIDRATSPITRQQYWAIQLPYMSVLGAVGAAITYILMDDDEREQWREMPDEIRTRYIPVKVPGLPLIRMPFDYGPPGAMMSFGFNKVMGELTKSPTDNSEIAWTMFQRFADTPGFLDVIVTPYGKTMLEMKADYSIFFGHSIVPAWMRTYYPGAPEMQAYANTEEIYRKLGKIFDTSPLMIEHGMRNMLGTSGAEFIRIAEKIEREGLTEAFKDEPANLPFIGRAFWRSNLGYRSRSVKELGEMSELYEGIKARIKKLEEEYPDSPQLDELDKELEKYEDGYLFFQEIRDLGKTLRDFRKNPKKHAKEIKEIEKEMTQIAQDFLKIYRESK